MEPARALPPLEPPGLKPHVTVEDAGRPAPPVQIPACDFPARGSSVNPRFRTNTHDSTPVDGFFSL
jgi:hypothetical protein